MILSWILVAAALALLVGGTVVVLHAPQGDAARSSAGRAAASATGGTTGGSAVAVAEQVPPATRAPYRPGSPRRLVIPALDVDSQVLPVRAPGGTLVPPSDPQQLGWWAQGARPGAARGSVLVAGHTVHTGGGALDDLETLEPGDRITVTTDRGRISYDVRSVQVFAKGTIAEQATRLFSQEVAGRLVLLTCEDWDGERYLSNVVVTARPVR